ncbi:MinD/ParA family protein [Candidatus Bathyarchaeota archaeon]|nr:MinD/ParA family protein [Candidatus Bathyarchaeota archaeon]
MGKIIAVHSYKGGTGKTSLSANLASIYARRGKKVCMMDLDFRAPSLHVVFKKQNLDYWLNDYLNGICEIDKVLVDVSKDHGNGGKFMVALANPSTEAIRDMTAKDRKWEMKALGRLLSLRSALLDDGDFDYIIFDTSPGLQYSSINAIVAADVVLVVTSLDASDINGSQRMTSELYDLFEKKTGILINKVIAEYLSSKEEEKKFNKYIKTIHTLPVLATIPCFCEVLRAAGDFIFTEERPDHPFTETIEKLATKVEKF